MYIRRKEMTRLDKDEEREERIHMEIIVDAYGPEEQALGWYYYLEQNLHFPFTARCIARRATSPLEVGDEAEVVGMAPDEECMHEMFVLIRWRPHSLAVPLMQLEGIQVVEETQRAFEDWHYWVARGYEL
jgi:Calcium binding